MTTQEPKASNAASPHIRGSCRIVRQVISKKGAAIKVIQLNLPDEMIKGLSIGSSRLPPASSA